MANIIKEDDIEQAILQLLGTGGFGYDIIHCSPDVDKKDNLNDGTGRSSKKECFLPKIFHESLKRINAGISDAILDKAVEQLRFNAAGADLDDINYQNYQKLRNSVKVTYNRNGIEDFELVKLIDFENPENNTFTAVSQMWIQGQYNYRRPDILIFVNGLPLVFIELKNSTVKVAEAHAKNLTSYKKDIPDLFTFNQVCVLSNGLETRLGTYSAGYEHFFEWLKASEDDKIDRKAIKEEGVSAEYFTETFLRKETLLDYIENFIIYENRKVKIIAKNHQYLGVNNLIESVKNRKELNGKLGVFWHTQGSGKSYSMIFLTRKVKRKIEGNFSFLIVTDRDDLDTQIFKNFVRTEVIGEKEEAKPANSKKLREYLKSEKPFIFTLIHKFRIEKGKKYPVLSTRDDIIVLVDEAHRTQYKELAENMRTALPNANFAAFTGTPLLGSKRLTNQWFGNYVSEYNFAQSVEDGSTVPLFYSRRVPEVGLTNNFLDDDVLEIIENENLNASEIKKLENSSSKILEVIKREDRLDKIAQDIAHHFPRRGFLGKGLVVSVDKFTAVKMYKKVQHYWGEEKKKLVIERNQAQTKEERDRINDLLDYMDNIEMAVVISEDADEEKKFAEQGLGSEIKEIRRKMNEIRDGFDIEDRFKDANDRLQLVFVCAMWLTGFDVKSLSTLYLDKPMKDHTLMQAIARANRVFPGKPCGIIVDYVNVFKYMQQALSQYAVGDEGNYPAKDIDKLISTLDEVIEETDSYLQTLGVDVSKTLAESQLFDKLEEMRKHYNIIVSRDEYKDKFKVLTNLMVNLYDASKPEIFERGWHNEKFEPIKYLHDLMYNIIDDDKLNRARLRMAQVLDRSITSQTLWEVQAEEAPYASYHIRESKIIDISKIDVEGLHKELKTSPYSSVEIDDLKQFLEAALKKMINKNCERIQFAERFKSIIDRYNEGKMENADYYEELIKLIADLKEENKRAETNGFTEEELEIYDLLIKGKDPESFSDSELDRIKRAAKNLYLKLSSERDNLLVIDWYKDPQPKRKVKFAIQDSLNADLPESYDKESFDVKIDLLLNHFVDMAVQNYGWIAEAA